MPNFSGIWNSTEQFQARAQNIWPAAPGAPTIGTATAGVGAATVAFTAPAFTGYPAGISSYTAVSTPGCITASGASSPVTVTGLTNGTSYTFSVRATGANGTGPFSAASNSVTPTLPVVGQQEYTTPGTYTWVAPAGVTRVSVIAVGGASAGGGGLGYRNNLSVTPGESLTVQVGAGVSSGSSAQDSLLLRSGATLAAGYGSTGGNGGAGSTSAFAQNSGGGNGGSVSLGCFYGGAGAGGYSGNGGSGGASCLNNGSSGSGGGGGGGSGNAGGGGVGIYGQGSNGTGGTWTSAAGRFPTGAGGGGSGGNPGGFYFFTPSGGWPTPQNNGGSYGGGGNFSGSGGGGAVRIIWPGTTRQFPSTNTGNL